MTAMLVTPHTPDAQIEEMWKLHDTHSSNPEEITRQIEEAWNDKHSKDAQASFAALRDGLKAADDYFKSLTTYQPEPVVAMKPRASRRLRRLQLFVAYVRDAVRVEPISGWRPASA